MASDDDAAAVPAAVEHTEGTSYVVPFGDPSSHPLPGSENYDCRPFPAAGGENPYQPEIRDMAPLNNQVRIYGETTPSAHLLRLMGNALSVTFYDVLRRVPERSRGLDVGTLLGDAAQSNQDARTALTWLVNCDRNQPGGVGGGPMTPLYSVICLVICLYRMCYRDGTLQACTERSDVADLSCLFDIGSLYFNLSARERERLRWHAKMVRRDRRMPTILARQLIIRKVDKKKLHGQLRRLVYGLFMTESDELFRVVVSFL